MTVLPSLREMFPDRTAVTRGVGQAAEQGYAFVSEAISSVVLNAMSEEASQLNLELGDHIAEPINKGTRRQVTQMHERAYLPIDQEQVPLATFVTDALAVQARRLQSHYPELLHWRATEAGYQLYRDSEHHISKHRDRRTDQLLAATITICGTARVGIHEPLDDPDDYTNTRQVDEFVTGPGTIMFLRAPGLSSGEQVIHDVSPPQDGPRLILNLRMRPDVLPGPSET